MRAKLKSKLGDDEDEEESDDEEELPNDVDEEEAVALDMKTDAEHNPKPKLKEKEKSLNPDSFVRTAKLSSAVELAEDSDGDLDLDDDLSQSKAIAEAFADDDVVAEFKSEKRSLVDAEKPKDLDTFLPGWGTWGGEGIKVSKRKRRRFLIKAPPAPKRRDDNKGHLILNDHKQTSVVRHQGCCS